MVDRVKSMGRGRFEVLLRAGLLAMGVCVGILGLGAARRETARPSVGQGIGPVTEGYLKDVKPLLVANCYGCHGDGSESGGIAFDTLEKKGKLIGDTSVWARVLKNVRSDLMPPHEEGIDRLKDEEKAKLVHWIKRSALGLDAAQPDPGRVTLRRLNRTEYRNTVRDLLGVDFKVDEEFPPDDTGYGFDNIADVLTVSPMLLEKYLAAATAVVKEAVPVTGRVMSEDYVSGASFGGTGEKGRGGRFGRRTFSFYEPAAVSRKVKIGQAGTYQLSLDAVIEGRYSEDEFDANKCELALSIDGREVFREEHGWHERREVNFAAEQKWEAGEHEFAVQVKPTTSAKSHPGELRIQLNGLRLKGPTEEKNWVRPRNYERFFGKADAPTDPMARLAKAGEILRPFATRAFRRPVDDGTVTRLTKMAAAEWSNGKTFEAGVAHAMIAVLSSPRFIFLEERSPATAVERYPQIDEYSLASRLSYFLWSSTPDGELMKLAEAGQLRRNLPAQVKRMLADGKGEAFYRNFTGQWLQGRDIEAAQIEKNRIMEKPELEALGISKDGEFGGLRGAFRQELERYFAYVVRENRSLLELIDSNYTFLNERTAKAYGIDGVKGDDVRRVELPPNSVRGGVLTMGGTLLVTSNPTRTSPVKRGLFLLENILGCPPPPPPPNIPALEEAKVKGKNPTLRETLEAHRSNPDCMSCHARMDPPGLAMENFNAIGVWREFDQKQKIDSTGKLMTGEPFTDVRGLKKILVSKHADDIYRCMTEKLMTYALGRGLEYYDVETVDRIVAALEKDGGKFDTLLMGVIDSSPFQRRRGGDGHNGSGAGSAVSSADR